MAKRTVWSKSHFYSRILVGDCVDRPLIVLLRGTLLTPIHVLKLASLRITRRHSNTVLVFLELYGHPVPCVLFFLAVSVP